jgi:hypothetical protein
MAEYDHEPRAISRGSELHAPHLRRRHDVSGDADDKEITEALIEDDLGWHPGIGAAEYDREGLLSRGELGAAIVSVRRIRLADAEREAAVAEAQPVECFPCGDHRRLRMLGAVRMRHEVE